MQKTGVPAALQNRLLQVNVYVYYQLYIYCYMIVVGSPQEKKTHRSLKFAVLFENSRVSARNPLPCEICEHLLNICPGFKKKNALFKDCFTQVLFDSTQNFSRV